MITWWFILVVYGTLVSIGESAVATTMCTSSENCTSDNDGGCLKLEFDINITDILTNGLCNDQLSLLKLQATYLGNLMPNFCININSKWR